jgi:hypothetical protein
MVAAMERSAEQTALIAYGWQFMNLDETPT